MHVLFKSKSYSNTSFYSFLIIPRCLSLKCASIRLSMFFFSSITQPLP